jgi:Tol biopolymer transport system component
MKINICLSCLLLTVFLVACDSEAQVTFVPATSVATATEAATSTPTFTPSPTPIPFGGGGVPLVAYIGGNSDAIELIIGDALNNQIYYSVPLVRKYEVVEAGEYQLASWYGNLPVSWSPDGDQILFVDQCSTNEETAVNLSICAYDLHTENISEVVALKPGTTYVNYLSWSFDKQWFSYQTKENNQSFVYLLHLAGGELSRFPNKEVPKWDSDSLTLYFDNGGNLSSWSSYEPETRVTKAINMRCESREHREGRENWGCVGYVPELESSLVQQDNKDEALLLLIDSEGNERLICNSCNSNFNYDFYLFSPNNKNAFLINETRSLPNWQGTSVLDLDGESVPYIPSNMLAGIAWAPDSSSYFAYRDESSFSNKPLLLLDATGKRVLYEYDFPIASWGVQKTDGHYPSLGVYWPASENEIDDLVAVRSSTRTNVADYSTDFAKWVPQVQAWVFNCKAIRWTDSINDELITDTLVARAGIARCEYKDASGKDQSISLATTFDLPKSPHWYGQTMLLVDGWRGEGGSDEIREYLFHTGEDNFPFEVTVMFGMPSRANMLFFTLWDDLPYTSNFRTPHLDFLEQLYSFEMLREFAKTGDPDLLDGLLVPIMTMGVDHSFMCGLDQDPSCINQMP